MAVSERAGRRAGPEDLVDYGRSIPAAFVPGELTVWPQETT